MTIAGALAINAAVLAVAAFIMCLCTTGAHPGSVFAKAATALFAAATVLLSMSAWVAVFES